MDISFTGHSIDVSDTLKEFTRKKFTRLENHFSHMTSIHVTFEKENRTQVAKATIHVPGNDIFASASEDDMYKSVDSLTDKLMDQVNKYKEMIKDH